jgi:hypothetical protein
VPLLIASDHAADLGQTEVAQLLSACGHHTVRKERRTLHKGGVHEPQVGVVFCFGVLSKGLNNLRHDVPKGEFEGVLRIDCPPFWFLSSNRSNDEFTENRIEQKVE